MKKNLLLIFILSIVCNLNAQHTFSIVAVDTVTGEVGSAGASCIANSVIISDIHPGIGAIHTQAYYIPQNQDYASFLMSEGVPPSIIIDSVTTYDYQGDSTIRQYGVVDLYAGGRSAAFTGYGTSDWKGHITGTTYSIQGNILLGPEILEGMEEGFLNTEGNLACKLMGALQGAKVAGADTRCLDWGISSESAFLRVAQPDDSPDEFWLDIQVKDVNGVTNANNPGLDPLDSLQTAFDAVGGCNYTGVGIKNVQDEMPLIFPQPTFGIIIFSINGNYNEIRIQDLNGSLITMQNIEGKKEVIVDSSEWPAGIYVYSISSGSGDMLNGKLIVE